MLYTHNIDSTFNLFNNFIINILVKYWIKFKISYVNIFKNLQRPIYSLNLKL